MATHDHGRRTTITGLLTGFGRVVLVAAFTGVETAALAIWLGIVRDVPVVSGAAVVGLGILFGGLVLEHFLTDVTVNGRDASLPDTAVIGLSASETALWAVWLAIAERIGGLEGVLFAGVVLAVLLVPQHTVEDNDLRGRGPFSGLLNLGTIGISLVESAGATVWLLFVFRGESVGSFLRELGIAGVEPATVGLGLLAAALFVEHNLGVSLARRG